MRTPVAAVARGSLEKTPTMVNACVWHWSVQGSVYGILPHHVYKALRPTQETQLTTHKMLLSHSHLGSTSAKIKCCERAIYWPARRPLATDLLVRLPVALLAPDRAILHLVATSALLQTD